MLEEDLWEEGVWKGLVRHLSPFLASASFSRGPGMQKLMVCHTAKAIREEPSFLQIWPYSPGYWEGQGTGRSHL